MNSKVAQMNSGGCPVEFPVVAKMAFSHIPIN